MTRLGAYAYNKLYACQVTFQKPYPQKQQPHLGILLQMQGRGRPKSGLRNHMGGVCGLSLVGILRLAHDGNIWRMLVTRVFAGWNPTLFLHD